MRLGSFVIVRDITRLRVPRRSPHQPVRPEFVVRSVFVRDEHRLDHEFDAIDGEFATGELVGSPQVPTVAVSFVIESQEQHHSLTARRIRRAQREALPRRHGSIVGKQL